MHEAKNCEASKWIALPKGSSSNADTPVSSHVNSIGNAFRKRGADIMDASLPKILDWGLSGGLVVFPALGGVGCGNRLGQTGMMHFKNTILLKEVDVVSLEVAKGDESIEGVKARFLTLSSHGVLRTKKREAKKQKTKGETKTRGKEGGREERRVECQKDPKSIDYSL